MQKPGNAEVPATERGSTRERIVAAAEALFARLSFDGVSLRNIAQQSGVPVGLVSYHFGGKLGVYQAIFEARVPAIVEQRKAGLALAVMEEDPDRRLELILKALLLPMLKLRSTEGGEHFGIIMAREVNDPCSSERGIIQQMFDPIAKAFIDQLRITLPERTEAEIHWAYQSVIGIMVYVMVDVGRISRLSEGKADPDDVDGTLRHLLAILLDGLRRR
ncbi:TetR/AcrR family transcriptional regulator [Trinickia sp. NRRL B-1857]|uniref:TetR/AcrR family transcriptional regulator n=1 Tax=Trinickia sp. NRRL B-1857 TaxID=3162879 RepID=UPI003D26EACD